MEDGAADRLRRRRHGCPAGDVGVAVPAVGVQRPADERAVHADVVVSDRPHRLDLAAGHRARPGPRVGRHREPQPAVEHLDDGEHTDGHQHHGDDELDEGEPSLALGVAPGVASQRSHRADGEANRISRE